MSFIKSVRQQADRASLEADKLIRIHGEQAVISQLQRDIKTQLDALAVTTLAAYRSRGLAQPELNAICQQIEGIELQIRQREARVEQIRAERLAAPMAQIGVPCPSCRQLIPPDAAFCPLCGFKIPKAPPAEEICQSCGSSRPVAAQFCPTCGGRKIAQPQTIRCMGCSAELPASAVFCPDCGTRTGTSAPPGSSSEPEPAALSAAPTMVATQAEAAEAAQPLTKRCASCQAELPIEATFCPECGSRQQAPAEEKPAEAIEE
ncbi:MAG: zinc ribbon domain-containing protein [Anaerolineae bacterium]